MEEIPGQPERAIKPERPNLLSILCILTFIGSGMNFFSNMIIAAFHNNNAFTKTAQTVAEQFNLPGIDLILDSPPAFFFVSGIMYIFSFAGALLMWNFRKTGFHLYTIAQILLIITPMYFLKMPAPSILDILFSGIFIILYSVHLKSFS